MLKLPDRMTDYRTASREVVLVKRTNTFGTLHQGRLYRWTYKSLPEHVAVHKAFEALVRDHPDERRTDWAVQ